MKGVKWFRYDAGEVMSLLSCIPDGVQRGAFLLLINICLDRGPLPDDDAKIALRAVLPLEVVKALRPYLNEFSTIENGLLMIDIAQDLIKERDSYLSDRSRGGKTRQAQLSSSSAEVSSANLKSDNGSSASRYQTQAKLSLAQAQQNSAEGDLRHDMTIHDNTNHDMVVVGSLALKSALPEDGLLPAPISEPFNAEPETKGEWSHPGDVEAALLEIFEIPAMPKIITNPLRSPVARALAVCSELGARYAERPPTGADVRRFAKEWNQRHMGRNYVLSIPFFCNDFGAWFVKQRGKKYERKPASSGQPVGRDSSGHQAEVRIPGLKNWKRI